MIGLSDHPDVILGQGTLTLEALEQLEENGVGMLNALIMASGEARLLAGAAIYCQDSEIKIYGTEPVEGGLC